MNSVVTPEWTVVVLVTPVGWAVGVHLPLAHLVTVTYEVEGAYSVTQ